MNALRVLLLTKMIGVALAATFLLGLRPALAEQKPLIKIGHLAAMSGFAAVYGRTQKLAIDMAVKDVNDSGGINGSKIVVLTQDDQLSPAQAVRLYRSLARQGVFAVIGPMSGTQWETVSPMSKRMKVPTIGVNAAKPGITVRPWSIRLVAVEDTIVPEAVGEFFKSYPKIKSIVIVGDVREASSKAAAEMYGKQAAKHGIKVLDTISFSTRATDLSPVAIKIKGLKPDAVLYAGFIPTALLLSKSMQAQGVSMPVLGNGIIWPGNFPHAAGDAGRNWHTMGYSTNKLSSGDAKLYGSFAKRYLAIAAKDSALQQPANISNNTVAYDAVMLLAKIMRKAKISGATDIQEAREKIKNGINATKTYVGLNKYRIRDTGDAYIRARAMRIDTKNKVWHFIK